MAKQHRFRVAKNTDKKVRDLSTNAKTQVKEKNSCVVYNTLCKLENTATREKQTGNLRRERRNIRIR